MPGSELGWVDVYFARDGGPGFLYSYDTEKFRYAAFLPDSGPAWTPHDLNFNVDYKRFGVMESIYSATNPDLRQFKRKGGKLLVYQGWNDQLEPPAALTEYYEAAERVIGNRVATQEFFRLFMIPGMRHCSGGEGAWMFDYLSYLEDWVERGKGPQKIVGGHVDLPEDPVEAQKVMRSLRFPLRPRDVTFSRPVYPYPLQTRYRGSGDSNDAASFAPVKSSR
jgi:feruloyl esterase